MRGTRVGRRLHVALLACIGLLAPGLTAGSDVADIKAVPFLGDKGRDGYTKFLAGQPTRAFALGDNGSFGYSAKRESRARAVAVALYHCNRAARNICRVYAVDDDVEYPRYAAFERQSLEALARLARDLGYTNVHWYRGGVKAWEAARLEMLPALQYGQVR